MVVPVAAAAPAAVMEEMAVVPAVQAMTTAATKPVVVKAAAVQAAVPEETQVPAAVKEETPEAVQAQELVTEAVKAAIAVAEQAQAVVKENPVQAAVQVVAPETAARVPAQAHPAVPAEAQEKPRDSSSHKTVSHIPVSDGK